MHLLLADFEASGVIYIFWFFFTAAGVMGCTSKDAGKKKSIFLLNRLQI